MSARGTIADMMILLCKMGGVFVATIEAILTEAGEQQITAGALSDGMDAVIAKLKAPHVATQPQLDQLAGIQSATKLKLQETMDKLAEAQAL